MNVPERTETLEQIQRAMGSMRVSDIWTLLLMGDLAAGALSFLITWNVGWRGVAIVLIGVTLVGGLVTLVGWVVAELRMEKAFKVLEPALESIPSEPFDRRAARRRLASIVLGLVALVIFLVFPAGGRWLALAPAFAWVVLFAWAVFGGSSRFRRRRHRR